MNDSNRLYNCMRCHQQVIICSHCDRGNIYCAGDCAKLARTQYLKQSGQRYQKTLRGKHMHAARQMRYRARQNKKVTHQGSPVEPIKTKSTQEETNYSEHGLVSDCHYCHFCKKNGSKLLRYDFLDRISRQKEVFSDVLAQGP